MKKCGRMTYGVSVEGVRKCVGVWEKRGEKYGGCDGK